MRAVTVRDRPLPLPRHEPSMEFLYAHLPLSYSHPLDFQPTALPLPAFADTIVGRRVEVRITPRGLHRKDKAKGARGVRHGKTPEEHHEEKPSIESRAAELNGQCGTVLELRPASGTYRVELDDGEV